FCISLSLIASETPAPPTQAPQSAPHSRASPDRQVSPAQSAGRSFGLRASAASAPQSARRETNRSRAPAPLADRRPRPVPTTAQDSPTFPAPCLTRAPARNSAGLAVRPYSPTSLPCPNIPSAA